MININIGVIKLVICPLPESSGSLFCRWSRNVRREPFLRNTITGQQRLLQIVVSMQPLSLCFTVLGWKTTEQLISI